MSLSRLLALTERIRPTANGDRTDMHNGYVSGGSAIGVDRQQQKGC